MPVRMAIKCSDNGAGVAARTPSSAATKIAISGNSGSDPLNANGGMPWYLNQITGQTAAALTNGTVSGSPMRWRWLCDGETLQADGTLYSTNTAVISVRTQPSLYDVLVITDASALSDTADALAGYFRQWCDLYWASGSSGAGAEVLLWVPQARRDKAEGIEVWSRTQQQRFEYIQDRANQKLPVGKKPVRIIPGAWVVEAVRRDVLLGVAPDPGTGLDMYASLFLDWETDMFHFNATWGTYLLNCVAVPCIYGISPHLMPDGVKGTALAPEVCAYIKRKVYDVVTKYPRAGVDTSQWVRV